MVTKKNTKGETTTVSAETAINLDEEAQLNQVLREIDFDSFAPPQPDSVSIELKKAREAKGLTFSDLHRLTGISRTTLHDYESSRSMPGAKELVKLCQALEVSPNRLLLGVEDLPTQTEGVLVPLIALAKARPTQALAFSAFLLPWVAATLSKIGHESLVALGTLADETLRARDPETYRHLSIFVKEIQRIDFEAIAKMSEAERNGVMAAIAKRLGEIDKSP